jgi:hypothetical protein
MQARCATIAATPPARFPADSTTEAVAWSSANNNNNNSNNNNKERVDKSVGAEAAPGQYMRRRLLQAPHAASAQAAVHTHHPKSVVEVHNELGPLATEHLHTRDDERVCQVHVVRV